MIFFALIIASVAFFIMIFSVGLYIQKSKKFDIFYRMRRHDTRQIIKKSSPNDSLILRSYKFIQKISKPLVEINLAQSLEFKLRQAGLPLLGGEYIVINFICSILVAVAIWLITFNFIFALISCAVMPIIIWFLVTILIQRRLDAFTEQLGDSLITISNALRAGYSFQQTIEVISKEMEPPIGEEFSHMNHEIFMGVPLEEALRTANKRIGSADFELVVTAVLIQREVGGNLAQILDNISYTIMERIRMKREILSLTAQGRFSAVVLLLLPFVAGVAMFFINQDNFMLLFDEPMGQIALGVSAVMEIIGYFIIRRIVDIDT